MSKKILFIQSIKQNSWGGSEVLWSQAATQLSTAGHSVEACLTYHKNQQDSHFSSAGAAGVKFSHWLDGNRILRIVNEKFFRGVRILKKRLRQAAPDLVVFNLNPFTTCSSQVAECRRLGYPYVLIIQLVNDHLWPDEGERRLLKANYSGAKAVYFVSHGNRALVENYFGMHLDNGSVISNPGAPQAGEAFLPVPVGETISFVCVGRIDFLHKGQDKLLLALSDEKWKARDWKLDFYGKGPNAEALEEMIGYHGLSDRVSVCGYTSDMTSVWQGADALVLPSRSEGFSLALLEAASRGRIIITTDVADNRQCFPDGEAAYIGNGCDVRSIDAALERAWQDRGRWPEVAADAKARASEILPPDPAALLVSSLLSIDLPR
jgi:glycosyltransferase involved in cell wall biosynthesis